MLIEFRVENHRSLREEQILSMEAGGGGDSTDLRPRQIDSSGADLLPVVALYGANASGKTNLLSAIAFAQGAVLYSANQWKPNERIPRAPFGWGKYRLEPSLFEVTILVDSIRYQYGFELTDECITEEWLFAWPHGKKQIWFEREGQSFKFGENLKGENKLIEGVTRANALFLSTAVQFGHVQLSPIVDWFRMLETINLQTHDLMNDVMNQLRIAELLGTGPIGFLRSPDEIAPLRERFMDLVRGADLGITAIKIEPRTESHGRLPLENLYVHHQCGDDDAWLPFKQESKGTQTLLKSALTLVRALSCGGVVLCDELESSLHPVLAQSIVRQFNDRATNPRNAQLIFTTHDTNLLGTTFGEPALRRDQVWLTEKNVEGATVLYPLTDFKPRKHENLERGYVQGRYGAIPFLGDFKLASE